MEEGSLYAGRYEYSTGHCFSDTTYSKKVKKATAFLQDTTYSTLVHESLLHGLPWPDAQRAAPVAT